MSCRSNNDKYGGDDYLPGANFHKDKLSTHVDNSISAVRYEAPQHMLAGLLRETGKGLLKFAMIRRHLLTMKQPLVARWPYGSRRASALIAQRGLSNELSLARHSRDMGSSRRDILEEFRERRTKTGRPVRDLQAVSPLVGEAAEAVGWGGARGASPQNKALG
jgi:hypothetical protein